jgi:hypothetical protein
MVHGVLLVVAQRSTPCCCSCARLCVDAYAAVVGGCLPDVVRRRCSYFSVEAFSGEGSLSFGPPRS